MSPWSLRAKVVCGLVCVTGYFATAMWLNLTYVDPVPKGRIVVALKPWFDRIGFVYIRQPYLPNELQLIEFSDLDDVEGDTRSPTMIYEDGRALGPAHSTFKDIHAFGKGRFLHSRQQGIIFTTSDNSDPRTNGRRYFVVIP